GFWPAVSRLGVSAEGAGWRHHERAVRADFLRGAGLLACAGGALAAPAPQALPSRFLARRRREEVCEPGARLKTAQHGSTTRSFGPASGDRGRGVALQPVAAGVPDVAPVERGFGELRAAGE